jgi:hypothetical protein
MIWILMIPLFALATAVAVVPLIIGMWHQHRTGDLVLSTRHSTESPIHA